MELEKQAEGGGDQTEAVLTENKQGRHCWFQERLIRITKGFYN